MEEEKEVCPYSTNGICHCLGEDDSLKCDGTEKMQNKCAVYIGYDAN